MNYKQLKLFAMVCMVFDHTVRIFPLADMLLPLAVRVEAGNPDLARWLLEDLPFGLMFIGRLAAPIFLFCVANGFFHTHDLMGYMRRILVTAVIAQLPYTWFELAQQRLYGVSSDLQDTGLNILFTLALGLLTIAVYDRLTRRGQTPVGLLAVAVAALLARLLHMEGKEGYLLLIFVFYLMRERPRWQRALAFLPAVMLSRWNLMRWALTELSAGAARNCVLNVLGNYLGMLAALSYNGQQGHAPPGFRRLLYAFYPVHLAVLALIGGLRPPFL